MLKDLERRKEHLEILLFNSNIDISTASNISRRIKQLDDKIYINKVRIKYLKYLKINKIKKATSIYKKNNFWYKIM